jgi:restriction endonuclease S subunit
MIKHLESEKEVNVYISTMNVQNKRSLGEICDVSSGKSLTKSEMIDGIYNVIGGGKIIGKHNQYNTSSDTFVITRVGDFTITYFNDDYYLTDNGLSLKSKSDFVKTQYMYNYIKYKNEDVISKYSGTGQQVISQTKLNTVEIPIPSLETQQKIVDYCSNCDKHIEQLQKEIDSYDQLMKSYLDNFLNIDKVEEVESVTDNSDNISVVSTTSSKKSTSSRKSTSSKSSSGSTNELCNCKTRNGSLCTSKGKVQYNGRCGIHKDETKYERMI